MQFDTVSMFTLQKKAYRRANIIFVISNIHQLAIPDPTFVSYFLALYNTVTTNISSKPSRRLEKLHTFFYPMAHTWNISPSS